MTWVSSFPTKVLYELLKTDYHSSVTFIFNPFQYICVVFTVFQNNITVTWKICYSHFPLFLLKHNVLFYVPFICMLLFFFDKPSICILVQINIENIIEFPGHTLVMWSRVNVCLLFIILSNLELSI